MVQNYLKYLKNYYIRSKFISMERIFHTNIGFTEYLYITLTSGCLFASLWIKQICGIIIFAILLIKVVEKLLHTEYVITDEGDLIVNNGRFTDKKVIPLQTITRIERRHSVKIFGKCLVNYLVIHHGYCKQISVKPIKEDEFVAKIDKFINDKENK